MSLLWIVLGVWIILAFGAAMLIGRAIRRADREELGSTLDWDPSTLDAENTPRPRD